MSRTRRGLRLLRQSAQLLRSDLELCVLPIAGFVLFVAVGCSLFALTFRRLPHASDFRAIGLLRMYPILIVAGIPSTFANAALVAGAIERLHGGDPTVGGCLRTAWSHRRQLVLWAVLAGSVGLVLQAIAERFKIAGPIARWTIGLAWQLASTFVVPVLLFEGLDVRPAVARSASLFKQRWGEDVVGNGAIAFAMVVVILPLTIVAMILSIAVSPVLMVVLLGLLMAGSITFSTTLVGVFNATLYDYAVTGEVRGPYTQADLDTAFRHRKRKRRWP